MDLLFNTNMEPVVHTFRRNKELLSVKLVPWQVNNDIFMKSKQKDTSEQQKSRS